MTGKLVTKADLVGTWKLVDFQSLDPNKKTGYPFGKNPIGTLVYTQSGYMSVALMSSDRKQFGLSTEQMQELRNSASGLNLLLNLFKYIKIASIYLQAARTYLSYSGTYDVVDNKVIHRVEVALIPDWTGTDLERIIESCGDRLVLSNTVGDIYYSIVWQRIS